MSPVDIGDNLLCAVIVVCAATVALIYVWRMTR